MRPVHLLLSDDGFMLIRIRSLLCSPKPHRLAPHCSMRTLPLLSSVCHRPSGVVGAAAGGTATACGAGGALLATGAGLAGAREGWLIAGNPVTRSSEAGGAGGMLFATVGAGGAGGTGGALFATGAGAGAGVVATGAGCGGGGLLATSSSSSDFLPFRFRFFRLIVEPLLVTERHDSELQFRGASMRIFCPSISKENPLPACAAVDAIMSAAAAAR